MSAADAPNVRTERTARARALGTHAARLAGVVAAGALVGAAAKAAAPARAATSATSYAVVAGRMSAALGLPTEQSIAQAVARGVELARSAGPVFAELLAVAAIAVAVFAGARAAMLALQARQARQARKAAGVPPRADDATAMAAAPYRADAAPTAPTLVARLRALPARLPAARLVRVRLGFRPSVGALAATGAARPEIARRTGLSQDAVSLALHLAARQV